MEHGKFILAGIDKKLLGSIKNMLTASGHIYLGYVKELNGLLRAVRSHSPDFIIIEISNSFKDARGVIEVIDEELLSACILLVDARLDEYVEFISKSRLLTYISKPVFDENLLQIVDLSLANLYRVIDYERKVSRLSDSLESRKAVEKAKWILFEKDGMTEEQAYEAIRKKSRDNRITMREIAEAIILTRG